MGNPISNAVLERINQILGNLIRTFSISPQTYVDKDDLWTGIFASLVFTIFSTTNRQKGYSLGQLMFVRDRVDWELIRQIKQTQINKDNACKNKHRDDYDYSVGDNIIITKHTA